MGFDEQGETRVIQRVQFGGDQGLVRGGELPFLEAEAPYALQK